MLPASTLIAEALRRAKVPNYTGQALDELNAILGDLCETTSLALARGVYNFSFNPGLTTMYGSGPYSLPLDYLRTSDSSGAIGTSRSSWYLYPTPAYPQGTPMYMVPIDLAEFDLYPQFPSQSTPERWATDMGAPLTQRITAVTTANLLAGSNAGVAAVGAGIANGLSMAGEGVKPGTTISGVVQNAGTASFTMSTPATGTNTAASVFFGIAPVGYAYPAPLGAYPVTIRYQRKMPPLTNVAQIPWFPHEGYLVRALAGRMMETSDDSRATEMLGLARDELQRYLNLADDKTNRAQVIQMDPRRFGGGTPYDRARKTKYAGW